MSGTKMISDKWINDFKYGYSPWNYGPLMLGIKARLQRKFFKGKWSALPCFSNIKTKIHSIRRNTNFFPMEEKKSHHYNSYDKSTESCDWHL